MKTNEELPATDRALAAIAEYEDGENDNGLCDALEIVAQDLGIDVPNASYTTDSIKAFAESGELSDLEEA